MSGSRGFHARGAATSGAALPPITSAPVGTPEASGSLDAELLRLGDLFERARAAEQVAWAVAAQTTETDDALAEAEALNAETGAIVDQIEAMPAMTLAGLQVKARAIDWCRDGDYDDETTSDRLTAQLIRVLLAMGSVAA